MAAFLRFCALLLLLCVTANAYPRWQLSTTDGQPGCRTRYEFTRLWRNNLAPHQFWECTNFGVPAAVRECPPGTFFQDSWQTCVPEALFEWTPAYNPPSQPGDIFSPCQPFEPEHSVTECPPCVTVCPPCEYTTICPPCVTTTTLCPPCDTTTLCPPCPDDGNGGGGGGGDEGGDGNRSESSSESNEIPFDCSPERMGIRWQGPSDLSYWECSSIFGSPTLHTCTAGAFSFVQQTCL